MWREKIVYTYDETKWEFVFLFEKYSANNNNNNDSQIEFAR